MRRVPLGLFDHAAMNLLLVEEHDLIDGGRHARVAGRRAAHLIDVIGVEVGSSVAVGLVGGLMGRGTVISLGGGEIEVSLLLEHHPPPRLDVLLVLALPRPKSLRRIVQGCAAMGLRALHLINSWRVEKSYWGSPLLDAERLRRELLLGAEQGRDTILPDVHLHRRFKPFVEDQLPSISAETLKLLGDAAARNGCPASVAGPITLVIGPEGGLIAYEVDMLVNAGFARVTLGPRTLRVEQAIPALLGRLIDTDRWSGS